MLFQISASSLFDLIQGKYLACWCWLIKKVQAVAATRTSLVVWSSTTLVPFGLRDLSLLQPQAPYLLVLYDWWLRHICFAFVEILTNHSRSKQWAEAISYYIPSHRSTRLSTGFDMNWSHNSKKRNRQWYIHTSSHPDARNNKLHVCTIKST